MGARQGTGEAALSMRKGNQSSLVQSKVRHHVRQAVKANTKINVKILQNKLFSAAVPLGSSLSPGQGGRKAPPLCCFSSFPITILGDPPTC